MLSIWTKKQNFSLLTTAVIIVVIIIIITVLLLNVYNRHRDIMSASES